MAINLSDLELLIQNVIEPLPDEYKDVKLEVTANTVFIEILFKDLPPVSFTEADAESLNNEIKDRLRDLSDYIVPNGFYRFDERSNSKSMRLFFTHNYCV